MEDFETKLGHAWITDKEVTEAMDVVRGYVKSMGGNPYDIEWFERPKSLPAEVGKAWDIVIQRAEDEETLGVAV